MSADPLREALSEALCLDEYGATTAATFDWQLAKVDRILAYPPLRAALQSQAVAPRTTTDNTGGASSRDRSVGKDAWRDGPGSIDAERLTVDRLYTAIRPEFRNPGPSGETYGPDQLARQAAERVYARLSDEAAG